MFKSTFHRDFVHNGQLGSLSSSPFLCVFFPSAHKVYNSNSLYLKCIETIYVKFFLYCVNSVGSWSCKYFYQFNFKIMTFDLLISILTQTFVLSVSIPFLTTAPFVQLSFISLTSFPSFLFYFFIRSCPLRVFRGTSPHYIQSVHFLCLLPLFRLKGLTVFCSSVSRFLGY